MAPQIKRGFEYHGLATIKSALEAFAADIRGAAPFPISPEEIYPREISAFRIVDDHHVIYSDRTGSGNETAAHMLADGRLTIMFCAFSGTPQIMRLYGTGTSVGWEKAEFEDLIAQYYGGVTPLGTRQIMRLKFDLVQTSCGYGVPLFDYNGERAAIENWHDNKGPEGIKSYWEQKNLSSIDDLPTGLKLNKE